MAISATTMVSAGTPMLISVFNVFMISSYSCLVALPLSRYCSLLSSPLPLRSVLRSRLPAMW